MTPHDRSSTLRNVRNCELIRKLYTCKQQHEIIYFYLWSERMIKYTLYFFCKWIRSGVLNNKFKIINHFEIFSLYIENETVLGDYMYEWLRYLLSTFYIHIIYDRNLVFFYYCVFNLIGNWTWTKLVTVATSTEKFRFLQMNRHGRSCDFVVWFFFENQFELSWIW